MSRASSRIEASGFEYRHQTLIHLALVGLASLTYVYDRVDVVWALIRNHPDSATWERVVFGFGALMVLAAASLDTYMDARGRHGREAMRGGRILSTLTVGLLLPLSGTILLLAGEAALIWRLVIRGDQGAVGGDRPWGSAFRAAAAKWGFALTMVAFVWTLQDRVAEWGAVLSVMLWLALNVPRRANAFRE